MKLSKKEKIVIAILAIIAMMIILCGNNVEKKQIEYTLGRGETLWEVYEEYGNDLPWGKWLYEMEKVNCKSGNEPWYYGERIVVICTK